MAISKHLEDFLADHPSIKVTLPADPSFSSAKQIFIESSEEPLLIARPKTENDVASLVGHLSSTSTPLVVRAGGHDISGRSVVQGAVQIDLRDIAHVRVANDRATARIGGGILQQTCLEALEKEGLLCTTGNTGVVGWPAWAMMGGYGILAPKYGLGCDQIVGARVALANGTLVDADARLLKAIRGAGTSFGVIVELQIKVYPLTKVRLSLLPRYPVLNAF